MEYFINTLDVGYWFGKESIKKIENLRDAKYMGYWCTKRPSDDTWNNQPVDVFYQENADIAAGHSNYFGLYVRDGNVFIVDAQSAFSEPIVGVICEDGEVLVSRYRHDYVAKNGRMVDGGRDYFRGSLHETISVTVDKGNFIFSEDIL